jgi:hypothetical protein
MILWGIATSDVKLIRSPPVSPKRIGRIFFTWYGAINHTENQREVPPHQPLVNVLKNFFTSNLDGDFQFEIPVVQQGTKKLSEHTTHHICQECCQLRQFLLVPENFTKPMHSQFQLA